MEKRLILAVVLTLGVIFLTNVLFPPARPPVDELADAAAADSSAVFPDTGMIRTDTAAVDDSAATVLLEDRGEPAPSEAGATAGTAGEEPAATPADTIIVSSPLYQYRFTDRGAAIVGIRLPDYLDYGPEADGNHPVELIRRGDRLLGYMVVAGQDTIDLRGVDYEVEGGDIALSDATPRDSLTFRHTFPNSELTFELTYRFDVTKYQVEVAGRFSTPLDRGYTILTSLGEGLRSNEANEKEDFHQLAFVVRSPGGTISSESLDGLEPGVTTAAEGGPFSWVAVKNKYFLLSYIAPEPGPGFGGLLVTGTGREHSGHMVATMPVPGGADGFRFDAYMGPQDFSRLAAIGQDLQNVNPYGWRWMRPIIKPLVGLILTLLTWFHETFRLAYGWVLILFGVLMRVVLFPLYQKSMRAQMAQMRVQPQMKEIQAKYKDDPAKLQQEMMKLYKEHGVNPLAGCLPMLLPFPILITLFFVFQNTIVFRGVPFLWLPDLSLADPIYVVPVLMGVSMFLLSWIGQRGMETTGQMKVMAYAMPVVFTFLFLRFPSGLNLYYASMNFASLPQQLYLSRERRAAQPQPVVAGETGDTSPGSKHGGVSTKSGGRKGGAKKKGGRKKSAGASRPKAKKRGA
jgi:YidC/Oxa1 family membrane protein insertase